MDGLSGGADFEEAASVAAGLEFALGIELEQCGVERPELRRVREVEKLAGGGFAGDEHAEASGGVIKRDLRGIDEDFHDRFGGAGCGDRGGGCRGGLEKQKSRDSAERGKAQDRALLADACVARLRSGFGRCGCCQSWFRKSAQTRWRCGVWNHGGSDVVKGIIIQAEGRLFVGW